MLAEKQGHTGDGQHREQEVGAKVSWALHASLGIVTREEELRVSRFVLPLLEMEKAFVR